MKSPPTFFAVAAWFTVGTDEVVRPRCNVGEERSRGRAPDDAMNKFTPAEITDPSEVIARTRALSPVRTRS